MWIGPRSVGPDQIRAKVNRWLSLDWDAGQFRSLAIKMDLSIADYIGAGGGRFLRGSSFYEDFVKTVCTINTSWTQSKRMVANLVRLNDGLFPSPSRVLSIGEKHLKQRGKLGLRAPRLISATKKLLADGLISPRGECVEAALTYEYLLSLSGIGPYAAAHCRVLLHDFSRLPVDSEVTHYLLSKGVTRDAFTAWGEYSFLGYKVGRILQQANWIGSSGPTS
jgi:N-glycosylase/DNA lyase